MASLGLVPASAAERGRRAAPKTSARPDMKSNNCRRRRRLTRTLKLSICSHGVPDLQNLLDRLARASARLDGGMAAPPPTRLRVAVGLKQEMVEIDAYPDTTWESAKLEACAAAGDLDATTHRLLFRGREPAPEDTVGGLGVKPTAKLMLLETEASKRERARQQQEVQMEELRRSRAAEFSAKNATDPVERSLSALAERTKGADALERDLEALERAVTVSSGAAGALGGHAAAPPDGKAFIAFVDACEKAVIGCDGVETHGDSGARAARKALVTRLQGLLRRADDARARNGDA